MERGQTKDSKDGVSPELRKCIRIQTIGMAIFLSWPVAMILADMYGLRTIIPVMSVLMILVAWVVFCIGLVGRQELKEQREREIDGDGKERVNHE